MTNVFSCSCQLEGLLSVLCHLHSNMGCGVSKPVFGGFTFQMVSYCLFQINLKFPVYVWEGEGFFHGGGVCLLCIHIKT